VGGGAIVAEFLASAAAAAGLARDADPPWNPLGTGLRAPDPVGANPPWLYNAGLYPAAGLYPGL